MRRRSDLERVDNILARVVRAYPEDFGGDMNYAQEAARRGVPMVGIAEGLRALCERVRAVYGALEGTTT